MPSSWSRWWARSANPRSSRTCRATGSARAAQHRAGRAHAGGGGSPPPPGTGLIAHEGAARTQSRFRHPTQHARSSIPLSCHRIAAHNCVLMLLAYRYFAGGGRPVRSLCLRAARRVPRAAPSKSCAHSASRSQHRSRSLSVIGPRWNGPAVTWRPLLLVG